MERVERKIPPTQRLITLYQLLSIMMIICVGGKILSTPPDNVIEDSSTTIVYPPKCYHCNINGFTNKDQYERHVMGYHRNLPCYPGPADLEKLGLTPQGMLWEQQLPRDQYFEFELDSKK